MLIVLFRLDYSFWLLERFQGGINLRKFSAPRQKFSFYREAF